MVINHVLTADNRSEVHFNAELSTTWCEVLTMRTRTYQLPHQVFFGFSDEVDAAFGAGVIGVGTLLRTTATPVL